MTAILCPHCAQEQGFSVGDKDCNLCGGQGVLTEEQALAALEAAKQRASRTHGVAGSLSQHRAALNDYVALEQALTRLGRASFGEQRRQVRILDLDNTIANDAWRIPSINWQKSNPEERYLDYHQLAAFDEPGNRHLFSRLDLDIVIFTARPVTYHALTEQWLRVQGVPFKHLLMRNVGDHRPSRQLKMQQLNWLLSVYDVPFNLILDAYDDRQDVVDAFASAGILAHRVAIHDTCAYTPPAPQQPGAADFLTKGVSHEHP